MAEVLVSIWMSNINNKVSEYEVLVNEKLQQVQLDQFAWDDVLDGVMY